MTTPLRLLSAVPLVLLGACAADAPLDWIGLDDPTIPFGDTVELAVQTTAPDARAIDFSIDGRLVGTCDPALPSEDCKLGDAWRWSIAFTDPAQLGPHTITATYAGDDGPVSISRDVVVAVVQDPATDEDTVELADETLADAGAPAVGVAEHVSRGSLDPSRPYHRVFGGISWEVTKQRVKLHSGYPKGSASAVASCMQRYGASIRTWADHYKISRASVVATATAESNCTNPAGSSDGLSSGPMQVTSSTCAAITGHSRDYCRVHMHTHPDFSFQVGAKYMASTYQRSQHHRDPPKIAAAYNAGSVRATTSNRWHMVSTGNHIDRWVRAYNAYRVWESQHGVALSPVEPRFDGAHVASAADLPSAAEGQVEFVGDFAQRDGAFWQVVDGQWLAMDDAD
jgi:hypothetical protein